MSITMSTSTGKEVMAAAQFIAEGVKTELNDGVLKKLNESIADAAANAIIRTQADHEEMMGKLLNLIPLVNSMNQRLERVENLLAANATPATSSRRVNATSRPAAGAGTGAPPAPAVDPNLASSHSRSGLYWGYRLSSLIGTGPESTAEAITVTEAINSILRSVNPKLATITPADITASWEAMVGTAKKQKDKNPERYRRGAADAVIKAMTAPQKEALKGIWSNRKKEEIAAAATKQLVPSE